VPTVFINKARGGRKGMREDEEGEGEGQGEEEGKVVP
jgi:hypothetical protein